MELFHPLLDKGYSQERKSNAGRKRIDPLILFKMLVLQQLFNLSDEESEFQVNDRRSFEEFVDLGVMNDIIARCDNSRLLQGATAQGGCDRGALRDVRGIPSIPGTQARGDQIIDATSVPVPKPQGFCAAVAAQYSRGERGNQSWQTARWLG